MQKIKLKLVIWKKQFYQVDNTLLNIGDAFYFYDKPWLGIFHVYNLQEGFLYYKDKYHEIRKVWLAKAKVHKLVSYLTPKQLYADWWVIKDLKCTDQKIYSITKCSEPWHHYNSSEVKVEIDIEINENSPGNTLEEKLFHEVIHNLNYSENELCQDIEIT